MPAFVVRIPRAITHLAAFFIAFTTWVGTTYGRDPGVGVAQPKNYCSPSGTYSLFIDPFDRYGDGGAKYRFSQNGAELFTYEKPYALCEVSLTDDGLAAGMAYRKDQADEQFLHIVIVNRTGKEILNETKKRQIAHIHGPTLPKVNQLIVDPKLDRLIVSVLARGEEFWIYKLATGESLNRFDLRELMSGVAGLNFVVDSRLIPGTPLVLVHWLKNGPDPKAKDYGAVFALIELEGARIWTQEAENDYANMNLGWVPYLGPRFFDRQSAIVISDAGRFDIRLFAENKQVAFLVRRDNDGGWKVTELGRINVSEEKSSKDPGPPDLPVPPLQYLGEPNLGATASESPLAGLWDFTFDSQGHIYALRRTGDNAFSMAALDSAGAIAQERTVQPSDLSGMGRYWLGVPRRKDDRYIQLRKDNDSDCSAWLVHMQTAEETPLKNYPGGLARGIAQLAGGGLVVLDAYSRQYSPADRLRCFDPEGKLRWEMRSDVDKDYDILGIGPTYVAVTTNDNIVLLNIDSIHLIDRDGKHLKKVDLTGAFGSIEFGGSPGYLHEVVADAEGGFLVTDFRNPPVVLRYNADGSLRTKWSPHHPDGKTFDLRPQIRVSPEGRLWTGDGNSIMRLSDDGVVDLVIGPKSSPDNLTEIAAFTADTKGNFYAVAHGTGAIHVFDSDGKPIRVMKPNAADVQGTVRESFVAVNDKGEVFLKKPATQVFMPPDEYLKFAPTGEQLETITFEPSIPVSAYSSPGWSFQPKTNYRCGVCAVRGDSRLVLVDPPKTLIHEQRRRPNGQWFGNWTIPAVAPDGSIAVLNSDSLGKDAVFELDFYTPQGEPLRTVQLPPSPGRYSGLAYDGSRAAVFGQMDALVVDTLSNKIERRSLVAPGNTEGEWAAYFVPGSNQVLLFDKSKHKIHKYELPETHAQATPALKNPDEEPELSTAEGDAGVEPEWLEELRNRIASLPQRAPCVAYIQKTPGGERSMYEEQAMLLSEEERSKLRTMPLDDCGVSFDDPRLLTRILKIAAEHGIDEIANKRVLHVGCCDLRGLQIIARMGVRVVQSMAGYSMTAMCNDWKDVGELVGTDGRVGRLDVLSPGQMDVNGYDQPKGDGFDLILVRSVIQNPPPDDYVSSPAWFQLGLGMDKELVASTLFSLMRPGGIILMYNIGAEPIATNNAFARDVWDKAGFETIVFNKDDRAAAIKIGKELGWDNRISPLEKTLGAHYSLLTKPKNP